MHAISIDAQTGGRWREFSLHFLNLEPVQKEIKLTEDQKQKIAKIQSEGMKRWQASQKEYQAGIKALAAETAQDNASRPQPDAEAASGTKVPTPVRAPQLNESQRQFQAEYRQLVKRLNNKSPYAKCSSLSKFVGYSKSISEQWDRTLSRNGDSPSF